MRQTPIHAAHVAGGGRMVDFAGWHMPVQYTGLMQEHAAVRSRAGLFDVSHMGEIRVEGAQALDLLQQITCNDVAKLKAGRAQYTALTTAEGTFVDDLLIYRRDENAFLLVVNAANTAKDVAWVTRHAAEYDVVAEDVSARWAQLALQGPLALEVLAPLVDAELEGLRYYGFVEAEVMGVRSIVSRTGYTGEDGFEIYGPPAHAAGLWDEILRAGSERGVVPVGLGARDSLRLEAKMALYGNDIDETTTVLEADLRWIVKLKKGEFVGRDVLARQAEEGLRRKLVGFEMQGRAIARHGYRALKDGETVGRVTSGTHSPTLKKNIGLAYLPVELGEPGCEFDVEIRGRSEAARVVPTPFYRRAT
ncbi:MAG: glycine cleavage system aminomethyltransferase GcvT [bacterium]|nr:glycine cleavage system aminomethyltransferase GcvT [bacterium]